MMFRAIWRLSMPGTFIPNSAVHAGDLGGELGRLAEDDDPALAEREGKPLAPAGGRDRLPVRRTMIDRGVGQLENGDAPLRTLERCAGEGLDAVDPLGVVAAPGDRVVAQEVFWRLKTRLARAPFRVRRVGGAVPCSCPRRTAWPGTRRPSRTGRGR